jgi:protein ImuB
MTATLVVCERANARAISSMHLMFDLEGGKQHERTVRLALPLQDTPTLLKLIQLDLGNPSAKHGRTRREKVPRVYPV